MQSVIVPTRSTRRTLVHENLKGARRGTARVRDSLFVAAADELRLSYRTAFRYSTDPYSESCEGGPGSSGADVFKFVYSHSVRVYTRLRRRTRGLEPSIVSGHVAPEALPPHTTPRRQQSAKKRHSRSTGLSSREQPCTPATGNGGGRRARGPSSGGAGVVALGPASQAAPYSHARADVCGPGWPPLNLKLNLQ